MAIYMKYDGIDGESEIRGRPGYLELRGFSWGLGRATNTARGGARADAEVIAREVVLTRDQDSISALLVNEIVTNAFDRKVEIEFIRTGANNRPSTFLRFRFTGAGLSDYVLIGGEDTPAETLTLRYTAFTVESFKVGDDLSAVPNTAGYDVSIGKAV